MMRRPTIQIAFTTSDALYAGALRSLMDSHIHHSLLWYESPDLGWLALEIDEDGAHFVHPNRALRRITKMECYEHDKDLTVGIRAMKEYLGRGYDWRGLASGIWRLWLRKRFGYSSTRAVHAVSRMFCSELVTAILQKSHVDSVQHLAPESTWPPLLLDHLKQDPGARRVKNPFGEKYEFAA